MTGGRRADDVCAMLRIRRQDGHPVHLETCRMTAIAVRLPQHRSRSCMYRYNAARLLGRFRVTIDVSRARRTGSSAAATELAAAPTGNSAMAYLSESLACNAEPLTFGLHAHGMSAGMPL